MLHSKARPKLQRLGWKSGHEFIGVVAPQCRHVAGLYYADPSRTVYLDRSPRLDGHSLRVKCPTM